MDVMMITGFFPLLITGMTTLGAGIAWMINRMDNKDKEERKWQVEERTKLEKQFAAQILDMQTEIHSQNNEISQLRRELTIYVRHVGVLEGLLKSQGIEPPPLILRDIKEAHR